MINVIFFPYFFIK